MAVIIRIRIAYGFETFFIGHIAIIENIIFDFRLMERARRPRVFLGRARRKDHHQNDDI